MLVFRFVFLVLTAVALAGCQRTDFNGHRAAYFNAADPNAIVIVETVRLSTTEFGVDGSQDNVTMTLENWGSFNADRLSTLQNPELVKALGGAFGAAVSQWMSIQP